jgi:hypothetical protein
MPAMAAQYGFDYEFVTYKWPHWLRKQTDKQRIIWAYKILFLDVLFPLDVPRMIFVDSDQVVRTDLAQLYNMDLKVCLWGGGGEGGRCGRCCCTNMPDCFVLNCIVPCMGPLTRAINSMLPLMCHSRH